LALMPSDPPAEVLAGIQSDFANAGAALGPPLGWPGVERFEAENAVILPEPFRTFVADVGNGCAEGPPEYGLVALGEPADGSTEQPGGRLVAPGSVRRPFPLTEPWVWEDDDRIGSSGQGDPDAEALLEAVHSDGFVALGTNGCGMDLVLVISGAARGEVWDISGEGAARAAPTFDAWVRDWAQAGQR